MLILKQNRCVCVTTYKYLVQGRSKRRNWSFIKIPQKNLKHQPERTCGTTLLSHRHSSCSHQNWFLRQNSQTRAAESAGELQRAIKQTPQRHNMAHSAQDTQPLNFQRRVSLLRKQMFTFWMAWEVKGRHLWPPGNTITEISSQGDSH